jgi:hypothetical protein
MRALFDRAAISLKPVQMLIGSRQDGLRHATDTCPCQRSGEETGSIGLGPTGVLESMILATSSGILLKSGLPKFALF